MASNRRVAFVLQRVLKAQSAKEGLARTLTALQVRQTVRLRLVCRTAALHCRTPSQEHGSVSLCQRKPSLNVWYMAASSVGARAVYTDDVLRTTPMKSPVGNGCGCGCVGHIMLALCGAGGPA